MNGARSRGCFITGYQRNVYLRFNGFLRKVFYSFLSLGKAGQMVSLKRNSQKTFLNPKFVKDLNLGKAQQMVLLKIISLKTFLYPKLVKNQYY